jgi:fatty-acid desaturase
MGIHVPWTIPHPCKLWDEFVTVITVKRFFVPLWAIPLVVGIGIIPCIAHQIRIQIFEVGIHRFKCHRVFSVPEGNTTIIANICSNIDKNVCIW